MADQIKLTKRMTQEQKDAVNRVYYKAMARKLSSVLTYALALQTDPNGDSDEVHKDCVKAHADFFPVELKHKQMMKLAFVESRDTVDQWLSHYYCCCGIINNVSY